MAQQLSPTEKQQIDIKRVEDYLNSLTTVISKFVQVSPTGGVSDGTFYLKRPDKLRWEYNPPTPIAIVAKGSLLTYLDRELQQISHIGIRSTPVSFLLRDTISFNNNDIRLTGYENANGLLKLQLSQESEDLEGTIILTFKDQPLSLVEMQVSDMQGQVTTVSFVNSVFGQKIEDKTFILQKPRRSGINQNPN